MRKTTLPLLAATLASALIALPLGAMAQQQGAPQNPHERKATPQAKPTPQARAAPQGTGQVGTSRPQGRAGGPAQGAGPQQGARVHSVNRGPGQPARLTHGALPRHD